MMFTILRMEYITNFQFSTKSFMHCVRVQIRVYTHTHTHSQTERKESIQEKEITTQPKSIAKDAHRIQKVDANIHPPFSHYVALFLRSVFLCFLIRWQCNTLAKISFSNEQQRRNVTYFVYSWTMNMLKITKCMSICDFWMRSPPTNCCHWKWTSKTEGERDRRRDTFSMAIRNYIRCAVKPTHYIE